MSSVIQARITPKVEGEYDPRSVMVELELPSGDWLDISSSTTLVEQLHSEDGRPYGSSKITLFANTNLPLDGKPITIDANGSQHDEHAEAENVLLEKLSDSTGA